MDLSDDNISFKSEGDINDLNECINDLTEKITFLREEVKVHMTSRHIQLQTVMSNNANLHFEATELLRNVKDLQLRLDTQTKRELASLTDELKKMRDSLEESNMLVEQVNKLLVIDTELSALQTKQDRRNHLQIMKHLNVAQKFLQEECHDLEYLDIYKTISETITVWHRDCYKEVCNAWEESVNITCLETEGNNKTSLLSISKDRTKIMDILMTLSLLGELTRRISIFANKLYKEILFPIIDKHFNAEKNIKLNTVVLVVSSKVKNTEENKNGTNICTRILHNLTTAFNYIAENLDYEIDSDTILLKEIGGYISEKLTTFLDEVCLTHTIPRKKQDLEAFSHTVRDIIAFENKLKQMQFLEPTNVILKRYSGSIDELFLNKTIEVYLDSARTLMKKDLQDLIEIEPKEIKMEQPEDNSSRSSYVLDQISLGLFQFPKCCISKSAEELILLVKEILGELVSDKQINLDCAMKLFGTARDMLMLFCLASTYHRKNIENIPQQAALLHNSLMFLAHEAMSLHLEFRTQYPSCLPQNVGHFVDLAHPLRVTAMQVLDIQVNKQQAIIVDMVKKAGLSSLSDHETLSDTTRKYLKQCLCQLSFLKNIWYTVLPTNVYCKIIGQLCQLFLEEMIVKVLATKDITADTTTELATVFGSIQEDVPSLFPEPKEVHRYMKNWSRFSELVYVLGGTLAKIEERWADGKGPLAIEFKPQQLKQLIKALFQTSDRRSAVLASIN